MHSTICQAPQYSREHWDSHIVPSVKMPQDPIQHFLFSFTTIVIINHLKLPFVKLSLIMTN